MEFVLIKIYIQKRMKKNNKKGCAIKLLPKKFKQHMDGYKNKFGSSSFLSGLAINLYINLWKALKHILLIF